MSGYSFDPAEFAPMPEDVPSRDHAGDLLESVAGPASAAYQMASEVERRLDVAKHYQAVLQGSFFANGGDAAAQVEAELREFCQGRLEILVGIRAGSGVTSRLTDDQTRALELILSLGDDRVRALVALADKLLEREGRPPGPAVASPEPQVSSKTVLGATSPSIRTHSAPAAPVTRQREAPGRSPVLRQQAPAPVAPPAPAPRPTPAVAPPVPAHRYVPPTVGRAPRTIMGQVGNPGAIPMPTGMGMTAATAQQASDTIEAAVNGSEVVVQTSIAKMLA